MYRFKLKVVVGVTILVASLAVLGAASVPAAKADGGIGLCIGCSTSPSTAQGSASICIDSARCATWFFYGGYLVWGPQTLFTSNGAYLVRRYLVFTQDASRYLGFSDCFYLNGNSYMFSGCFWNAR